jgi:hypothetical protein
MDSRRTMLVALIALVLSACAALDPFGPNLVIDEQNDNEIVQGQVRVTLTVIPEVIDPPGTVVATLTYENLGRETVVLTSGYGCPSFAHVYLGNERIPFPATQYGCTAAASHRDLEPGTPLTVQWPLVIGGEGGMHVRAGAYRFVAELNTHGENLERTFVVR